MVAVGKDRGSYRHCWFSFHCLSRHSGAGGPRWGEFTPTSHRELAIATSPRSRMPASEINWSHRVDCLTWFLLWKGTWRMRQEGTHSGGYSNISCVWWHVSKPGQKIDMMGPNNLEKKRRALRFAAQVPRRIKHPLTNYGSTRTVVSPQGKTIDTMLSMPNSSFRARFQKRRQEMRRRC